MKKHKPKPSFKAVLKNNDLVISDHPNILYELGQVAAERLYLRRESQIEKNFMDYTIENFLFRNRKVFQKDPFRTPSNRAAVKVNFSEIYALQYLYKEWEKRSSQQVMDMAYGIDEDIWEQYLKKIEVHFPKIEYNQNATNLIHLIIDHERFAKRKNIWRFRI